MSFEDWQKDNGAVATGEPDGFAAWQTQNTPADSWDYVMAAGGRLRQAIATPVRPAFDNLLATVENPKEFEDRMAGALYLASTLDLDSDAAYDMQSSLTRQLFRQPMSPSQMVVRAMGNEELIQRYVAAWNAEQARQKPVPLAEQAGSAAREIPENLWIGTVGMTASGLAAIKRRGMQLMGAGIFPDEEVRRFWEPVKAGEKPARRPNALFRNPPQLPGAIASEAVSVVTRLPEAGRKALAEYQGAMVSAQDEAAMKTAPLVTLSRMVWQGGVPSVAVAMGVGVLTGDPTIALGILGELTGGQEFQEQIEAGGSLAKAGVLSELAGAAEIAGETLVLPRAIKGVTEGMKVGEAIGVVLENATQEGATGFVQTFLNVFGRRTAEGMDPTQAAGQAFVEGFEAIPSNAFVGGAVGVGMAAPGMTLESAMRIKDSRAQRQALRILAAEGELTEQVVGQLEQTVQEVSDAQEAAAKEEAAETPGAGEGPAAPMAARAQDAAGQEVTNIGPTGQSTALPATQPSGTMRPMAEEQGVGDKQTPSTPQTAQGAIQERFNRVKQALAAADPFYKSEGFWQGFGEPTEQDVAKLEATLQQYQKPAKSKKGKPAKTSNLLDRYDSGDIGTVQELADEADRIATETGNQDLAEVVQAFRDFQREDRELAGRGDWDTAEKELIDGIRRSFNPSPRPQSAGTPQPPAPAAIVPPAASGATVEANKGTIETPEGGDTGEPKLFSARQAWIDQHRRRIGLDGINSTSRRNWAEALARAWEQKIPENALRIAGEVQAKPRALSDVETAGLVVRAVELENEHADLMGKIGPSRDAAQVADLSARAATIEAEYDGLTRALYTSGSEKGRALASQKLTINESYSLVAVKARMKAAKGAELTAQEVARAEELTAKLAEKTAQVEALEKELNKIKAEAMLKRLKGAQRLAKMTAEQKAADIEAKREKVRKLMEAGCR